MNETEIGEILSTLETLLYEDPTVAFAIKMLLEAKLQISVKIHDSDLVSENFDKRFRAALLVHHSVNLHTLDKKAFEYSFRDSLRADGRTAELDPSSTYPGADIAVDSIPISLKTEGAKSTKREFIHISKLMESAWMKPFKKLEDFQKGISDHILKHLGKYERMFSLRAFSIPNGQEYELVEIPLEILRAASLVRTEDLSPITKAHGTHAWVKWDGVRAFRLTFDGSDDKITIASLARHLCKIHAEWRVTWSH